jgi:trehalose synthase
MEPRGIQDQIEHGYSGLLIDDPGDLEGFGAAVSEVLVDRKEAGRLGVAAERRVRERFLHDRHLAEWVELLAAEVQERNGTQTSPRSRLTTAARPSAGQAR